MIAPSIQHHASPRPVRVAPPHDALPALKLLRTVIRNPIEVWPQAVYEEPLYRRRLLSRDTVFVMDPDLVRTVLVDEAAKFTKSEAMLRSLEPALGEGLLTADGERWRWQRRAAAPIFRHERILGFVGEMIAAAERRRDAWLSIAGGTVDVAHEMMHTTFDIIVETMLSGRAGIDAGRVERGITDYLESTSWTVALALLRAPRWVPYPGRGRAERARDYLREEVLRIVAARRHSGERRSDLIGLLLEARDPETDRAMSDQDLADNLLTFITAGHETTALALTWTFYLLDLHPEIADRVVAEVATVTAGGPLRPEHVEQLAYTRQVLQEAMRLYPPAPIVVRAAQEDLVLAGERIPAGTSVYVPVYAIHRHVRLWDEPDRFDPERFVPSVVKARHRYAYLPFGAGPRICIGMSFALLEAAAILAVLLPVVRLSRASGRDPDLKLRITLRPGTGLPMRVARRQGRGG
ncbi:cytochrome P450 [Enterovirga aerilata]|uniref:Cytochrome P450 n=1 Tax=Enterovirga aerilata TaxID=2730920 RepID=A0A849I391_9HYPH|nr:cytochrome P450 [Enterovirga sp. DB1703]